MKYYVIEIAEGDAKITGRAIYEYETEKDAVSVFHKKLGTAMTSDLYTTSLVQVFNSDGDVIKSERYEA